MGGSVGKGLDRISNYCSEVFISIFCKVLGQILQFSLQSSLCLLVMDKITHLEHMLQSPVL